MNSPITTGTVAQGNRGKGKGKPIRTRLDLAKAQVLNAVQGIAKGTRYHLVTFAADVRVWNRKAVRVGAGTSRTLTQALSQSHAVGGTNVFAALMHALGASQITYGQELKGGVEEIFLLSDGMPTHGDVKDPDEILRIVRLVNRYRKIRINTVFAGTGKGASFMQKLAQENFGTFVRR